LIRRYGARLGLLGQIIAIFLGTVTVEFGVSTFLYERASRLSLEEDEAHRLAEQIAFTRRVVAIRPASERAALARMMSDNRYEVRWRATGPAGHGSAPALARLTRQVIAWEPQLADSALSFRLVAQGAGSVIEGSLRLPDTTWLTIGARNPSPDLDLVAGRILRALLPAIAFLVIATLLIRSTLRPLRKLASATDRIGYDEPVQLDETGTAEVRRLIRAYNAMQERIYQLVEGRTQALAAVGHDLRTPIARLKLRAEQIDADGLRSDVERDLDEIDAMLGSLRAFLGGETDPEQPTAIDIAVMMATIAEDFEDRGYDTRYDGPEHLEVRLRVGGMRRALINLVENALHYGERARLSLTTAPGGIVLAIEDDGPGIPPDKMGDVLQPFVRLDEARARNTQGLGLGLAIATGAALRDGGELHLRNREAGGLRAELRLPAA
jgi:two-component system osmolarity sensor histidine kinase EnvZ